MDTEKTTGPSTPEMGTFPATPRHLPSETPGRWEDYIGKIVLGDCMDVLRQIPDGAVDVLLTDPPYGNCEVRITK